MPPKTSISCSAQTFTNNHCCGSRIPHHGRTTTATMHTGNPSCAKSRKARLLTYRRLEEVTLGFDVDRRDSPFHHDIASGHLPEPSFFPFHAPETQHYYKLPSVTRPTYVPSCHPVWGGRTLYQSSNHSDMPRSDLLSTPHTQPIDFWLSTRPQVASLVGAILVTRTNLKKERLQCERQEKTEEELFGKCMARLHALPLSDLNVNSREDVYRSYNELKICRADLRSLRERTAALEDTLSNYEYQLERLEEEVYTNIPQARQPKKPAQEQKAPSSILHTTLPIQTGQHHNLGLQERLYTRMGDIRIYHERLSNFEFDLRDRVEEREAIRAAGQNELTSNSEFFERARAQRLRIKEEHDKAHEDVRELKLQCLHEGIEFEEPDFLNPIYCTHPEGTTPNSEPAPGLPNMIEDYFASQERTAKWLGGSAESTDAPGEIGEEVSNYGTRRASASPDIVWVQRPSSEQRRGSKPPSRSASPAAHDAPQWRSGPPPSSARLEALLLESASTPSGAFRERSESDASLRIRHSFPPSQVRHASIRSVHDAH
jgi:hypothetical protein